MINHEKNSTKNNPMTNDVSVVSVILVVAYFHDIDSKSSLAFISTTVEVYAFYY